MSKNYILKRKWQSRHGLQEELYLGYNANNKLDCIPDIKKAKPITEEEIQEWLLALPNSRVWIVDALPEEYLQNNPILEENYKENNNAENNN